MMIVASVHRARGAQGVDASRALMRFPLHRIRDM